MSTTTESGLSDRDRATLRAVAAGRCLVSGDVGTSLRIPAGHDGLACSTRCGSNQPLKWALSQPALPEGPEGERTDDQQEVHGAGCVLEHSGGQHQQVPGVQGQRHRSCSGQRPQETSDERHPR